MADFDSFCKMLLSLDSRERGRLIAWQRIVADCVSFLSSVMSGGAVAALSNHAAELAAVVRSLTAIGAAEEARAIERFADLVEMRGFGDSDGYDLAAIYGQDDLTADAEALEALLEDQEADLWRRTEEFARARSASLAPLDRDGRALGD